jgi:hypothetical protein
MLAALLALMAPARGLDAARLWAFAAESPGGVELRVFLPAGVDPGSVRVQLAGRRIVVVARDAAGRQVRSRPLVVEEPVVEEGAGAVWEGEGWLTITLRAQKGRHR